MIRRAQVAKLEQITRGDDSEFRIFAAAAERDLGALLAAMPDEQLRTAAL